MGKATHISLLISTARQPDESIKESTSAIGRATSMCSFSLVDLFRLLQAAETDGGNSRCRAIVLSARKESCRNQGDMVDTIRAFRISSAVGDMKSDERECARVCRLCVAKQMSDDFCSEEPSLLILRDEFNGAEPVHLSRQTSVILQVTML
jgi:hypothetical protein